jgi:hypothetical protein
MCHVVLLGDSTLDNAAYVAASEDVTSILSSMLSGDSRATLLAIDGSVIADIAAQVARIPPDATHLIVSVGGNDAILASGILGESVHSMADALTKLTDLREAFSARYQEMLDVVAGRNLPTAICTIYEGAASDPEFQRLAATALTVLNDCITREGSRRRLPLIDLRVIFDSATDYANPIEPSAAGGRKLAAAIAAWVTRDTAWSEQGFG